jgi:hypothetical protein
MSLFSKASPLLGEQYFEELALGTKVVIAGYLKYDQRNTTGA